MIVSITRSLYSIALYNGQQNQWLAPLVDQPPRHHLLRHLDHHHSAQQQLLAICWRKLEFSTAGPSLATCARSIIPKIMDYDIATTVKIRQQEYLMMMKTIMFISKIMDYLSLSSSPDIIKIGQRETLTMMKLITMIKPSDDICGLGHTRAPLGMTAHFSADKTLPNSHTNLILWLPFELGMETVIVMIRGIIMIIMMTTDNQTRSSTACHVGPLALERLIIFEQFWTHLNKFWTGWSTFNTFE